MGSRKWNGLGKDQIKILRMVCSRGRTTEEILSRIRPATRAAIVIHSLMVRGLLHRAEGLYVSTDHGKAVLKPDHEYKRWLKDWGKA